MTDIRPLRERLSSLAFEYSLAEFEEAIYWIVMEAMPVRQAAAYLGVSYVTAYTKCKKFGIPLDQLKAARRKQLRFHLTNSTKT